MSIIDLFKKQIHKPNLVFPRVITDSKFIKSMDSAFQTRNAYWISVLYRKAAKDEDILTAQKLINQGLEEQRNLTQDDRELITNISKAVREIEEKYIIFESVGNLMFISEVSEKLQDGKEIPEVIKITCFLWLYQNMVEVILAHLSEIFCIIAKKRKQKTFLRLYAKHIQKEEHLMMGQLLDYAKQKDNYFTSEHKNTFLHHNELRNRLAHANCFYDSIRKEIILKNNSKLTIEEFEGEFKRIKDFLYELISQLNESNSFDIKKDVIKLANRFFKMSRDPAAMAVFKNKKTNNQSSRGLGLRPRGFLIQSLLPLHQHIN